MMNFVYPQFLWALLLLTVPLVIHLFNFRRYRRLPFTNVKWLKDIQQESTNARTLKKWLVLLSRLIALACIIIAFAMPFFKQDQNSTRVEQIVIYIDNSLSMEREGLEGPLFEEAKSKALAIIKSYGEDIKFAVLHNSNSLRFTSFDRAESIVKNVELAKNQLTLAEINQKLTSIAHPYQLYVISDFQKSAFSGNVDLDSANVINFIHLPAGKQENISVDSVWFDRPIVVKDEPVTISFSITNHGSSDVLDLPVKLNVEGQIIGTTTLMLPSNQTTNSSFDYMPKSGGWSHGKIVLEDEPIRYDDELDFSFEVKQELPVLVISDNVNPWLKRLYSTNDLFSYEVKSPSDLDFASLNQYRLIVLADLQSYTTGLAQSLLSATKDNTSICVFSPRADEINSFNRFTLALGIQPANVFVNEESKVGAISFDAPLFQNVFDSKSRSMDLPMTTKSIDLSPTLSAIMEFENGKPYLTAKHVGNSFIYQFAVKCDEDWGNLPKHALFVPIMYNMALFQEVTQTLSLTIGTNDFVTIPSLAPNKKPLILKALKSDEEVVPEITFTSPSRLYARSAIENTGTYALKDPDKDSVLQYISFNQNRKESDLLQHTQNELKTNYPIVNVTSGKTSGSFSAMLENKIHGKYYWKWFILIALVFLMIEIFLLRLIHR